MPPPKRFKINAKNFFLTYPQCSIGKESAIEQLQTLQTPINKKYIRVCRELHENGEPHLHALIQFEGKFQCTNCRLFDLKHPHTSSVSHPNIQSAKSSSDVKSYIEKDGDYVEWGHFQIDGRSARGGQQTINDAASEALNASSKEEAMQIIKEKLPEKFLFQYHNLCSNLDRIFKSLRNHGLLRFNCPHSLTSQSRCKTGQMIISEEMPLRGRRDLLVSSSRVILEQGKTMWARALGTHNYLSGHLDFNSRVYSNNAEYNVIDDIAPQYLKLKHWKELIGAQKDWQSNCKYGKPVQIKGGVPCIILCNAGEGASYKSFLDREENASLKNWTLHNAKFVFLSSPLYQSSTQSSEETSNQTTSH
ncbi:replication associated protein [Cowpea bright yellow mosaic virus]|uniref:Replication-associated protein n=1 Tax=Cowpea bright yellow mosaic virus TaxID=2174956 RepID=A0A411H9P5_9GEMI|nr:replication associated protein [Cowpea bright yellow mosaic virus]QBB20369.1 replication associated protein [Cowpea bright yellow mosaic virus]